MVREHLYNKSFNAIALSLFLAPTDVPSNFTGYVVDSNTITVSWAPPPPHHHNGIIRMYIIDVMENETGNSFSVVSLNTSATIAPLHPDYHYLIAVRAVTVLPGPVSSSVILRTDEDSQYFNTDSCSCVHVVL